MSSFVLAAALLCCCLLHTASALNLPQVFNSHMVLQRAPLRAKLYGQAGSHATVTCTVDRDAGVKVSADGSGRWQCELPPYEASLNHTVTVAADAQTVVYDDVAFGDVVLCLGQSNMELSLNYTFDGASAIADAVNRPHFRLFGAFWNRSPTPLNDTNNRWSGASWRVNSPDALYCGDNCPWLYFAATCYYYALAIDNALGGSVPLGLMHVTYGGTYVEEWTRPALVDQCGPMQHDNSTSPNGQIYNAMVAPLLNLTIHVTLWYQGETNTDNSADALRYACAFRTMVADLQRHQRPNAPFYFVLLAPAVNSINGSLPLIQLWSSQLVALALPHTAVANTIDLGDRVNPLINEIHPRNKTLIGARLARIALSELYGQPLVARGPTLRDVAGGVRVERVAGAAGQLRVVLSYERAAENSLLHVQGTAECDTCCDGVHSALFGLVDVSSSGSNRTAHYYPSHVSVDVERRVVQGVVTLPAADVSRVRVDFENAVSYPQCALYNADSLPALPFSIEVDVRGARVSRLAGTRRHDAQV